MLDCACGTGYGVRILRKIGEATGVIGVDIDDRALAYASERHQVASSSFICSSGDRLPVADRVFDAITSFETIEHVPDDAALIEEFHRVLRADGILIISTPNRWPLEDAPFHVREYDRESFLDVLNPALNAWSCTIRTPVAPRRTTIISRAASCQPHRSMNTSRNVIWPCAEEDHECATVG